jgi:3-hydroxyisobutyryl-CoA hydrolase
LRRRGHCGKKNYKNKDIVNTKNVDFFKKEYKLDYLISSLKIPHISIISGYVMGGGVGVSVNGKYRIATETSLFSMPETQIGFFCDVGGSYFLSRLDSFGMYLGLTGERLKGEQLV